MDIVKSNKIQILRGLAIIAVVLIHTSPKGFPQIYVRPFINFAVPLFLFLSGYLTNINQKDWFAFGKKRVVRVLVPYVVWTLVYTLLFFQSNKLVFNLLTTKAAIPFYYIFVYIQFVLLTPLIGYLAESKYSWVGWIISPISLLIYLIFYNLFVGGARILWHVSCMGWFTFYYLGIMLRNEQYKSRINAKVLILLLLVLLLMQMTEGYLLYKSGWNNPGTQLKLSNLLSSSLCMILCYQCLESKMIIQCRLLSVIGNYSFGIFFTHIMFLNLLGASPVWERIPFIVNSAIIVTVSFLFCYLLRIILGQRLSRWFGLI